MCLSRSVGVSCLQDACWGEGSTHRWVLHHVVLCVHVWSDIWVIKHANFLLGLHVLLGCRKWVLYCTVFTCWYCPIPTSKCAFDVIRPSIGAKVKFYYICMIFSCNFGLDCLLMFDFGVCWFVYKLLDLTQNIKLNIILPYGALGIRKPNAHAKIIVVLWHATLYSLDMI